MVSLSEEAEGYSGQQEADHALRFSLGALEAEWISVALAKTKVAGSSPVERAT